jgi:hypothetical protein
LYPQSTITENSTYGTIIAAKDNQESNAKDGWK